MSNIYQNIAQRTNGDIYIGVVGPVRTGKSTFIKKFMDKLVIPHIEDENNRMRANDELPQSAEGRTIMTTEPKFVPNEAVRISLDDNAELNVRLVDCVGFIVPSSQGYFEDDAPRKVSTPWSDIPMDFEQAAEVGTHKVINEHSTIGLVITTDGSITDIPRHEYEAAEERVIEELKAINKPFVIVLNSATPSANEVKELQCELEEKYGVPVIPTSCLDIDEDEINKILESVLFQFPLSEAVINMPAWFRLLDKDHWLIESVCGSAREAIEELERVGDVSVACRKLAENEHISRVDITNMDLGCGTANVVVSIKESLFYKVLSEITNLEIEDEYKLVDLFFDYTHVKQEYEKISAALDEVKRKGYGIVSPTIDELVLEEPEITKQGSRYGVRLRASAPSIHMIRADIETEVNPIVGTEKQSEELVNYMLQEFKDDPTKIWESNIFGKSLHDLVNEGLHNKLDRMPDEAQFKLQETLTRIINEGSGGLICIIL